MPSPAVRIEHRTLFALTIFIHLASSSLQLKINSWFLRFLLALRFFRRGTPLRFLAGRAALLAYPRCRLRRSVPPSGVSARGPYGLAAQGRIPFHPPAAPNTGFRNPSIRSLTGHSSHPRRGRVLR